MFMHQTHDPCRRCFLVAPTLVMVFAMPFWFLSGCTEDDGSAIVGETSVNRSPPDLSTCTKIEIWYQPSALEGLIRSEMAMGLFSDRELAYFRSLDPIVVDDPQRIRAFAEDVAAGVKCSGKPEFSHRSRARVFCLKDGAGMVELLVYDTAIRVDGNEWFHYPRPSLGWRSPMLKVLLQLTPDLRALVLRRVCARNLYVTCSDLDNYAEREGAYPSPAEWCDALIRQWQRIDLATPAKIRRWRAFLQCPAAGEGECHFAMNPECTPDSPDDMVLLFETEPGWNQHGGPELFTFEHHDPRGGLVLLSDGTVKFIRTQEELEQLRWK